MNQPPHRRDNDSRESHESNKTLPPAAPVTANQDHSEVMETLDGEDPDKTVPPTGDPNKTVPPASEELEAAAGTDASESPANEKLNEATVAEEPLEPAQDSHEQRNLEKDSVEEAEENATESDLLDLTVDFDAFKKEKTVQDVIAATIEGVATQGDNLDATVDSDASSADIPSDGDLTMDSNAGSASDQCSIKARSVASSGSGFNSQLGVTGNASRLARMWDHVGGESGDPMSSLNADEQIASVTLFGKLRPRSLSGVDASEDTDTDYQLMEKLGEGAMGVVFAARQKAMDRTVAIKAIKPGKHESDDSKRKFLYEAQITGDLDHPNIVPIHELGSNSDGTLFYAMKLVSGNPWQKVIKKKSREENLDVLMKVSDAIGFAHSKGIIHRDLKPENVMLGPFGEVLVMDWGLAVSVLRPQPFGLCGTPAYMSPEMARHDKKRIGTKSDIYLLGAMLFQIVSGRPPHTGKGVSECLMSAVRNEFAPHNENDPLIVIAKTAMADDVSDRYETVAVFQDAIREYRRHAESIAITERAAALLVTAKEQRDYQSFSGVLFSLNDALDLWPENQSARKHIVAARLAYGQCAFEKGDFDLCLQTLVPGTPDEDAVIAKAQVARDIAASREQRFKRLRRVLAGVILFAVVGLSALSAFLNSARVEIDKQRGQLAQTNTQLVAANDSERRARKDAERAATQEKLAKETAIRAAEAEEKAKIVAQEAAEKARQAAIAESTARKNEAKARMVAEKAFKSEKTALATAVAARDAESAALAKSLRSAMVTTLGSYQSRLNLALAQAEQYDVVRSHQLLSEIKEMETQFSQDFQQPAPLLSNWAFRRVGLLINEDLPRFEVGADIRSITLAANAPVLATVNGEGLLTRFKLSKHAGNDRLTTPTLMGKAVQVACSSDGNELAFTTIDASNRFASWVWNESTGLKTELPGIGGRPLQKLSYSPDGHWLVGGINGGIWIWERTDGGFSKPPRRALAKGSLQSIQFGEIGGRLIANCLVEIASSEQSSQSVIQLDLTSGQTIVLEFPPALRDELSAIAVFGDQGDLLVGSTTGQLYHLGADVAEYELVAELLPRKHATRVSQIDVSRDGRFLTHGHEPVAHVWSLSTDGENRSIKYQQSLLGLANNIQWCRFSADGESVFAIDQLGKSINWDLSEQATRRSIVPTMGKRNGLAGLPSMIEGIVADKYAESFQTIDGNGVAARYETWPAGVGRYSTIPPSAQHFVGHTPNAEMIDAAFSTEYGQLVTLARRTAGDEYGAFDALSGIEYCQWDMASGNMVRRLHFEIDSEARVEIVANGSIACVGGDSETHLINLETGTVTQHPFGSSFAVANPVSDTQVMLVKSTGAIERINLIEVSKPPVNQFQLASYTEARPVDGVWSPSGNFFYVLYENGRIARFAVGVDSIDEPILADAIESLRVLPRVRAWHSVDWSCSSGGTDSDVLACIIRSTDGEVSSRLMRLRWPHESDQLEVTDNETMVGDQRLAHSETTDIAQPIPLKSIGLSLSNRSLRSLVEVDGEYWIAVGADGDIQFGEKEPNRWVRRTGRTKCISASADRLGRRWLVLQDNGCLWKFDNAGGQSSWQLQPHVESELTTVHLSPSGRNAIALATAQDGARSATLYDIETNTVVRRWNAVASAAWHPIEDRLLMASVAGEVSETGPLDHYQSSTAITSIDLLGDRVHDVGYFRGTNADDNDQWYAALLRDHGGGSRVSMHRLSNRVNQAPLEFGFLDSQTPISTMASSPTENILVTGDESGTLVVWFAAPSLDESPRELFTLSGHRGAAIECVAFSKDGSVLFSADRERRMLGHPSDTVEFDGPNVANVVTEP